MLDYRLRPMTDTTWVDQVPKRAPLFKREWPEMSDVLGAEVAKIGGYDITIDVHAPAESLTNRGGIRRGAVVWSTAVIVAFDTEDRGEMVLRCDRYRLADRGHGATLATGWQLNAYAVALHLQGLRDLDRHGVARGEQYDAYKALPSGSPSAVAAMSADAAVTFLTEVAGRAPWPFLPDEQRKIVRLARRLNHPDAGGTREGWDQVEQAVLTLITAGVLPEGT